MGEQQGEAPSARNYLPMGVCLLRPAGHPRFTDQRTAAYRRKGRAANVMARHDAVIRLARIDPVGKAKGAGAAEGAVAARGVAFLPVADGVMPACGCDGRLAGGNRKRTDRTGRDAWPLRVRTAICLSGTVEECPSQEVGRDWATKMMTGAQSRRNTDNLVDLDRRAPDRCYSKSLPGGSL